MRIGILGTGRIAAALVEGLCTGERPPQQVVVSPRNAEVAAALAARFAQVSVGADNQAVLDACDCVVLSLRPPMAAEVLSALRFRPNHQVVSVMALVPLATLRALAAPAAAVVRAMTLPAVARRSGPILYCPEDAAVGAFLGRLGTAQAVADEGQLEILWATTAMIAPFYALVERTGAWAARHGADPQLALRYAAGFYHALAAPLETAGELQPLIAEAQTPGGLNEQALRALREGAGSTGVDPVLDAILARLVGA